MTFPLIVFNFQFIRERGLKDEQVALFPIRCLSASAEKHANPLEEKTITDSLHTFQIGGNGP